MPLSSGDKSSDDFVEIVMRADPKPISGVAADARECAILQANADRPKPGYKWLPMKRAMIGIRLPQLIGFAREIAHVLRQPRSMTPRNQASLMTSSSGFVRRHQYPHRLSSATRRVSRIAPHPRAHDQTDPPPFRQPPATP